MYRISTNCNTGFSLKNSPRVEFTNRMFQIERAQRPPDDRAIGARAKVKSTPSLADLSLAELERIEETLMKKRPYTARSRQHIHKSLDAVRAEIRKRKIE
jgi:hypothetical protein